MSDFGTGTFAHFSRTGWLTVCGGRPHQDERSSSVNQWPGLRTRKPLSGLEMNSCLIGQC